MMFPWGKFKGYAKAEAEDNYLVWLVAQAWMTDPQNGRLFLAVLADLLSRGVGPPTKPQKPVRLPALVDLHIGRLVIAIGRRTL
jgi:uncharacterized protein (DUF3820 family)